MIKLGVLISGSGTNMMAIQKAIEEGRLDAEICLVVSSREQAEGVVKARKAGLETLTISKELYKNPVVADEVIAYALQEHGCEYVVMAGYMRMVHAPILQTFEDRVLNIHPALLPSFPGAHAIKDAYEAGVKITGVTVHFANNRYDAGPCIAQEPVRIEENMTLEDLEACIHKVEHALYPRVLQLLAHDKITILPSRKVQVTV